MLNRHGTRLELGTVEDMAELNAVEAMLRSSYQPSTAAGSCFGVALSHGNGGEASAGTSLSTGDSHPLEGGNPSRTNFTIRVASGPSSFPLPPTADVVSGPRGTGDGRDTGPAPHVHIGHSVGSRGNGSRRITVSSGVGGHTSPALTRGGISGGESPPPGRPAVRSTADGSSAGAATDVSASSRGMRPTAPPFYHPRSTMEGVMYPRGGAAGSGGVVDGSRDPTALERGRPTVPSRQVGPASAAAPSSASFSPSSLSHEPVLRGVGSIGVGRSRYGEDGEEEEEAEEAVARPSRISGRYHLPRSGPS